MSNMDLLNKAKGIINDNKEVYYPAKEVAGGINDSNLKYNVPKDSNNGGGGDPGYFCKEEITTVVNAAVTTVEPTDPDSGLPCPVGDIPYNKFLNAEKINVKFNGTDYICDRNTIDDFNAYYGADGDQDQDYDWSEYPFRIQTSRSPVDGSEGNILCTENAGVYDIKIDEVEISVDVTPCFEAAVKKVTSIGSIG